MLPAFCVRLQKFQNGNELLPRGRNARPRPTAHSDHRGVDGQSGFRLVDENRISAAGFVSNDQPVTPPIGPLIARLLLCHGGWLEELDTSNPEGQLRLWEKTLYLYL
jgi:hypothetical protein